jgi:bifunctional DNA-binding transcriptional regulator/antitoxin component of YhaV-PrlF toxin-antitoxin module
MPDIVSIDGAGRVVIPRRFQRRLGLTGPGRLEIRHVGDHVELRVAPVAISGRTGDDGLPVLEPEQPHGTISTEDVRAALEQSRW